MLKKCLVVFSIVTIVFQSFFGTYVYASGPQIVVDGKTQTSLKQNGNITDINTETVRGNNAFNSFEIFNVETGKIVNLYLPKNTENLLNLVHNQRSDIDGVLNSIKNGEIAGNVYFLNPHGIIVGSEGRVNVGSLTAVTPTPDFMNSIFSYPNNPSSTAVDAIMSGSLPIDSNGLISISGKVNAVNDIELIGGNIEINAGAESRGEINTGADFSQLESKNEDRVNFSDVVNVSGLKSGEQISTENGNIKITSENNVVNKGNITADGKNNLDAGNINISAAHNIELKEGSLISAGGRGGDSNGGVIIILADNQSLFEKGALIEASAEDSGDAGFMELSALKEVFLDGGKFDISAEEGQAGTVYIDPEELNITSDQSSYGGTHIYEADLIRVWDNVVLSTQNINNYTGYSKGDSGDLTLKGSVILLKDGSKLLANAVNDENSSYQSGDVNLFTLTETNDINADNHLAEASSRIEIDGAEIKGKNITIKSDAMSGYSWQYDDSQSELEKDSTGSIAKVNVKADAEVLIKGNSQITAEEKLDISAHTDSKSLIKTQSEDKKSTTAVAYIIANLDANSAVSIEKGSKIAADLLNLSSSNNAVLDINAASVAENSDDNSNKAAVAVTSAHINSIAEINKGVEINAADINITAENQNSFSTTALAMSPKEAKAGVAAAVFEGNTDAKASYAGTFVTGEDLNNEKLNSLNIKSVNNNIKNSTAAVTAALSEDDETSSAIKNGSSGLDTVRNKLAGSSDMDSKSGAGHMRLAGAVSFAESNQNAESFVGDSTEIEAENITISSEVSNQAVENRAISTVTSTAPKKDESEEGGSTTTSLSAALSYGDYNQQAEAYTGINSVLKADKIDINSSIEKNYTANWTDWNSLSGIINNISNIISADKGGYLSSYTNSTGSAENVNLAGSLSYLDFDNNSLAYTGRGTQIYGPELNINAANIISGIYFSGNLDGFKAGTTGGSKSAGGTYNQINYNNNTQAYILEGTSVQKYEENEDTAVDPMISVTAENSSNLISITPTAGKGSTWGFNGTFSLGKINNTTEASISNRSEINAGEVNLNSHDKINSWSLSGAFNKSENAGVGAGLAFNEVKTETNSYIGDNSRLIDDKIYTVQSGDTLSEIAAKYNTSVDILKEVNSIDDADHIVEGQELTIAYKAGSLSADKAELSARTDGSIDSTAVAGAEAAENDSYSENNNYDSENPTVKDDDLPDYNAETNSAVNKADSDSDSEPKSDPSFGLGISGSAAYNITSLNTSAYIEDILADFSADKENRNGLSALAVNNTDISAYSGAASLVKSGNNSNDFKVALAGSMAVNDLNNNTRAYGNNIEIPGSDYLSFRALTAGEYLAVALGAAVNTNSTSTVSIAGSASINESKNTAQAYITDSILDANSYSEPEEDNEDDSSENSSVEIEKNIEFTAYDKSKLGTGGGALLLNGKAGVGTAVSYSHNANSVRSYLKNITAEGFNTADINAFNSSKIASGAAMGSFTSEANSASLAGSFAINKVDNTVSASIENSIITGRDEINLRAEDSEGITIIDNIIKQPDSEDGEEESEDSDYEYSAQQWKNEISEWEAEEENRGSSVFSAAGLLQAGGNNVGISMVWNDINNNYLTEVINSDLKTESENGQIKLSTANKTQITGISVGAGISSQFAGAAAVVVNKNNSSSKAVINSDNKNLIETSNLYIKAEDNSKIDSLASQLAFASKAALGGAVIYNDFNSGSKDNNTASVESSLKGVELKTDNSSINSQQNGKIRGLAASGAASPAVALAASVIYSDIYTDSKAGIKNIYSYNEGNNITVNAEDNLDLQMISGSGTAGSASIGGSVTINNIEGKVKASAADNKEGTAKFSGLKINSSADRTVDSRAYQGSGGYYFSGGAAAAVNNVDFDVISAVEEGSKFEMTNDSLLELKVDDEINILSDAQGYQLAGAALGAVFSSSKRSGNTMAQVGNDSNNDEIIDKTDIKFQNGKLNISAFRNGKIDSFSRAGSGGVAALNASQAEAADTGKIYAELNNTDIFGTLAWYNSSIYGNGTEVNITAEAQPALSAEAKGYSGSIGGSAGLAKASSSSDIDIKASADSKSYIKAEDIIVKALNNLNEKDNTAYSYAEGIAAGILLGANAALSEAVNTNIVKSYIASELDINKKVDILADNNSSQEAYATGIGAGAAAVGANYARAESRTITAAAAGNIVTFEDEDSVGGRVLEVDGNGLNMRIGSRSYNSSLSIKAEGNTANYAESISGSGGVISGAAASAKTINDNLALAEVGRGAVIGRDAAQGTGGSEPDLINIDDSEDILAFEGKNNLNNIIKLKAVNILAEQNTVFDSSANSVQAAVAGMSGAESLNIINSAAEANLGDGAALYTSESYTSPSYIKIKANNIIEQAGSSSSNAEASAGGVINGSAAESKIFVAQDASVNLGENSMLFNYGSISNTENEVQINVFNSLNINNEAVLSTGGAVESPYAETVLKAGDDTRSEDDKEYSSDGSHYLKARVNIADSSSIISSGGLDVGAYTQADGSNRSLVKTYGGVGFAGGKSLSFLDSSQKINIEDNVYIMAYNDINLRAGQKGDGSVFSRIDSSARTDVFNYTALPLDTSIKAYGSAENNSILSAAGTAVIDGVQDVVIGAYKGHTSAVGYGEGHNPYLEAIGSKKTGGDSSRTALGQLNLNGQVNAGVFNEKSIYFKSNGEVELKNLNENIFNTEMINPHQQIEEEIEYLNNLKDAAESDGNMVELSRLEGEIETLTMLKNVLRNSDSPALEVNNLFSSGGNITLDSDNISGNGQLNASGGPKIEIINETPKHLLLNELIIPDRDTGGRIFFGGSADGSQSRLDINSSGAEEDALIKIENISSTGEPSIFLKKGAYNRRGLLDIYNKKGNFASFDKIRAKESRINVPNGAVIINSPGEMYNINSDPLSAWYKIENLPSSAWLAAQYVATAEYIDSGSYRSINDWLRDQNNKMYPSDQDYAYPDPDDGTYVFGDVLPNDYENSNLGSVKLFNDFWMQRVYEQSLNTYRDTYPDLDLEYTDEPAVAGQIIGINADRININGKIKAGSPVDWDINIDSEVDSWIADQNSSGSLAVPEKYYDLGEDINEKYYLEYDFDEQKLVLGDINASGGGYVYLHGNIISTNPMGEIEVLNGLGNVKIDNYSSKILEINNINTGTTAEGRVKIVDTLKNETSWYVNKPGENIKYYHLNRTYNTEMPAAVSAYYTDSVDYAPLENVRYEWKRKAKIERDLSGADGWVGYADEGSDHPEGWFYDYKTHLNPWRFVKANRDDVTDKYWHNYYEGITVEDNSSAYERIVDGRVTSTLYDKKVIDEDGNVSYKTYSGFNVDFEDTDKGVPDGKWHYILPSKAEITIHNSIKADNEIPIKFTGSSNADLQINSDAGLIMAGIIDNIKGDTEIKTDFASGDIYNGNITQHDSALINTGNLTILADNNIGSITQPLQVSLENGSNLTASSRKGNINIAAPRDKLLINYVNTDNNSSIYLSSDGNIESGSFPAVNGGDITLISEHGNIGSEGNNFKINAAGNLSAAAGHNISIENIGGDLRLLNAHSRAGDVRLTVPEGKIIDAVRNREIDTEKQEELAAIWEKLHLTDDPDKEYSPMDDAEDTTVIPYKTGIDMAYDQYWSYMEKGFVDENGNYHLNPEFIDFYRSRLGENSSDQKVKQYTQNSVKKYKNMLNNALYEGWKDEGYREGFNYTITSAKRDKLTKGAEWKKSELVYQINRNALLPESNTQYISGDLNLKGNNIKLYAEDDIGKFTEQPVVIDLNSDLDLSIEQEAALAGANLPGDIKIIKDENESPVRIEIKMLRPIYSNPKESIYSESYNGNIFIYNSEGSLSIDKIKSMGDIRLIARDNITDYHYNDKKYTLKAGEDSPIILEAGEGSIGTEDNPVAISSGYLANIRAAENIYLEKKTGDLLLNRIYAGKEVNLKSPDSITGIQSGLSILADELNLYAGDSITGKGFENNGIDTDSLEVELKTGKLSAEAGGEIDISSSQSLTSDIIKADKIDILSLAVLNISDRISGRDVELYANSIYETDDQFAEGFIEAENLSAESYAGQIFRGENKVNKFKSTNLNSGNIVLNNSSEQFLIESIEQSGENVEINNTGNTGLGYIKADSGDIYLETSDSITAGVQSNSSENDLNGNYINLRASNGTIGKSKRWINLAAEEKLDAEAYGDIFIRQNGGDLYTDYINSQTASLQIDIPAGRLNADSLTAENLIDIKSSGDIYIDKFNSKNLNIFTQEKNALLQIRSGNIEKAVNIKFDNQQIDKLIHIGNNPLYLDITGGSKTMAEDIFVNIVLEDSNQLQPVIFNKLYADKLYADVRTDNVEFRDLLLGSRADIYNSSYYVTADNINKKLFDSDLQLYPEDSHIYLKMQADRKFLTDAYIVNYDPDFIVNEFSTANSFIRISEKITQILSSMFNDKRQADYSLINADSSDLLNILGEDLITTVDEKDEE